MHVSVRLRRSALLVCRRVPDCGPSNSAQRRSSHAVGPCTHQPGPEQQGYPHHVTTPAQVSSLQERHPRGSGRQAVAVSRNQPVQAAHCPVDVCGRVLQCWLPSESATVFPFPTQRCCCLPPFSFHRLLLPLDSIVSATPAGDVLNIRFASGQPDLLLQVRGAPAACVAVLHPISVHGGAGAVWLSLP